MATTPLVQNPPPAATPAPAPTPLMTPMQTTTVKALILVGLSQVILALLPMLQSHVFDPWQIGTQLVPIVAGILVRMASGDVQAPAVLNAATFGLLNAGNPK